MKDIRLKWFRILKARIDKMNRASHNLNRLKSKVLK